MSEFNELKIIDPIDESIENVSKRVEINTLIRESVIEKLASVVQTMNIADERDGKLLASKMELVSTLNSFLDSNTKDATTIAKLRISKKTTESAANLSEHAASILKLINGIEIVKKPIINTSELSHADDMIDQIVTEDITESVIAP